MKLRPIRPGDTIALVSPASPMDAGRLEPMVTMLSQEGYQTRLFPHALDHFGYLAGTDEDRAADLMEAFADPNIAAVLCTRGGYGCSRLLPFLDFDAIARSRKALIGFSDITVLHVALQRRGVPSLHSPMPLTLSYPRVPGVFESFRRALKGELFLPPEAPHAETLVPGVAQGRLVGGCLSLLADTVGTSEELDTEGRILVIEGVDDPPHRVDAMLTHLRNTGHLARAAGLVFGEMTRSDEHIDAGIGSLPWREIVADRVADLGIPTILNFPFGHAPCMTTLPLGVEARLDAATARLTLLDSPWDA